MKRIYVVAASLVSLTSFLMADLQSVSVGGTFLGGPLGIMQENRETKTGKRQQFDFAANVDIEVKLDSQWAAFLQLQASPGAGALGFPGPESALTDANITYSPNGKNWQLLMGSFDMPFGLSVSRLTNNADTFANDYITNDLLYSMFAGPVGTLNTIGAKFDQSFSKADLTVVVSNGTDESSQNEDGGFALLAGVSSDALISNVTLGASVLSTSETFSQDPGITVDGVATIANFNSRFLGYILDLEWELNASWSLGTYVARLQYDDQLSGTDDDVTAWMFRIRKNMSRNYVAFRVSGWSPDDNNGSGSGMSQSLVGKTPGLATLQTTVFPVADQQVIRYDVVYGMPIQDHLTLKAQVFMDDYLKDTSAQNTDVLGAMAMVNLRF